MKSITQKLLATIFLATSMGQLAFADSQTEQPGSPTQKIQNYACLVMASKADNSGFEIIQQKAFAWDTQKETSEVFFKEADLAYAVYSEAKSGNIAFTIMNTATKTMSTAVGDMNKVLILFDSASKRIFGCGAGSADQIKAMANAPSVK